MHILNENVRRLMLTQSFRHIRHRTVTTTTHLLHQTDLITENTYEIYERGEPPIVMGASEQNESKGPRMKICALIYPSECVGLVRRRPKTNHEVNKSQCSDGEFVLRPSYETTFQRHRSNRIHTA